MTEDVESAETAGSLLRAARQAAGLHISVLALRLKVPVTKIEGLESNQWDVFADPVFARTLAISACKQLRIDPAPILALLPKATTPNLDLGGASLNQRFQGGSTRRHRVGLALMKNPLALAVPLLIVAALLLYFWLDLFPAKTVSEEPVMPPDAPVQMDAPQESGSPASAPSPAPSPASAPASGPEPAAPSVPAAGSAAGSAGAGAPAHPLTAVTLPAEVTTLPLTFTASATSWVQVTDAMGKVVFSKTLQAGEVAQAQGLAPLKVVLGNASATQVSVKDRGFDFQSFVVSNVARFEVQP